MGEQSRFFSAASPIFILLFLWVGVIVCLANGVTNGFYVLLGVCICLLGASGWRFVASFGLPRAASLLMAAGVAVVGATWAWQRLAYAMLVPAEGLAYGYFLTPGGRAAGILILRGPTIIVGTASTVLALASGAVAWRAGERWSIVALLSWWLAVYITFMLPSAYLDAQGNASVFI